VAVAGVVHQEVDAAEMRQGAPAGLLGLLALGNVAGQHERLAGARSDLRRQGLELRFAPRHERHPGALTSQAQRQGPADPAGGARDERRQPPIAGEFRHAPHRMPKTRRVSAATRNHTPHSMPLIPGRKHGRAGAGHRALVSFVFRIDMSYHGPVKYGTAGENARRGLGVRAIRSGLVAGIGWWSSAISC